ncbi:SLC13 family permease [Victivallis vadensis]|uniref:SLC13 family permease n=1 Tax=Victivallis vadensis TaxID=172901 RepID=UPI0023F35E4A|nr:SLC13 family permease [Victivallis vadensis]
MHDEAVSASMSVKALLSRFGILLAASLAAGLGGGLTVLDSHQATACAVFVGIIFGTLFFWGFRLAIAFLGLAVLIFTNSLNIPQFVTSSSLEVILFLVGMMVIVGALRDLGFFTWIVQLIVAMPNLTGRKFITVTAIASALLACAVDEVTSIIFVSTLIFQVCDRLKLNPTPYILIAVLCTNVGSAGTMMGNPVGIYIGTKGMLTFGDFMLWAFPLMLVALFATVGLTLFYFRRQLREFDVQLKDRLAQGLTLAPLVKVPYKQGLLLITLTILAIASHHPLENLFGLAKNSVLLITPLVCAGIVMILKQNRARHYIEQEVDWWTLLFFMLLFAVAGTLEYTHVDRVMAHYFTGACGNSAGILVPFIFVVSAIGSAFIDNVIFVAAFCPVIEQLSGSIKDLPLWWALLFGACFGGNITMIGSTANIVALGMLEKRSGSHITFFQWFRIGALSTVLAGTVAVVGLLVLEPLMPDRHASVKFEALQRASGKNFDNKNVILTGRITPSTTPLPVLKEFTPSAYRTVRLSSAEDAEAAILAAWPLDTELPAGISAVQGRLQTVDLPGKYPHVLIVEQSAPVKAAGK